MNSLELQIGLALVVDLLLGDPRWFPHPVRGIGRLAVWFEAAGRAVFINLYLAGTMAVLAVLGTTGLATGFFLELAAGIGPLADFAAGVLVIYTSVAMRDLVTHSRRVYLALAADDLELARQRVGMLVGRDPRSLDREGIVRACVESVAENVVDGVIAPLFYAALGGPLAAMLYRAVNTLDSTFGYKNEKYEKFGWAAARLDDLLNYIPARLTGLLLVAAAALLGLNSGAAIRILVRDRLNHASPNGGHPEAAVAGALGIRLGGPSSYFGRMVEKPFIGEPLARPGAGMILLANRLLYVTGLLAFLFLLGIRLILTA